VKQSDSGSLGEAKAQEIVLIPASSSRERALWFISNTSYLLVQTKGFYHSSPKKLILI